MSDTKAAPETQAETDAPTADAAPAAAPADGKAGHIAAFDTAWSQAMAGWLVGHVANSPISRETGAFNHLVETALPALRQAIKDVI